EAQQVLVEHSDAFMKGFGLSLFAKPLLGDGLLTSEGELHRRQRRMMAPAFVHKRIAGYAGMIAERSETATRGWEHGATIDLSSAMMRLTLEIIGKALFSADVGAEALEISHAITVASEHVIGALYSLVPVPPSWPTPANRKNRRAIT